MAATGEGRALDWSEVLRAAAARSEARRRASFRSGLRRLVAAAGSGREVDRRGKRS